MGSAFLARRMRLVCTSVEFKKLVKKFKINYKSTHSYVPFMVMGLLVGETLSYLELWGSGIHPASSMLSTCVTELCPKLNHLELQLVFFFLEPFNRLKEGLLVLLELLLL